MSPQTFQWRGGGLWSSPKLSAAVLEGATKAKHLSWNCDVDPLWQAEEPKAPIKSQDLWGRASRSIRWEARKKNTNLGIHEAGQFSEVHVRIRYIKTSPLPLTVQNHRYMANRAHKNQTVKIMGSVQRHKENSISWHFMAGEFAASQKRQAQQRQHIPQGKVPINQNAR